MAESANPRFKRMNRRQDAIGWFAEQTMSRTRLITLLNTVADIERLINRIAGGNAYRANWWLCAELWKMYLLLLRFLTGQIRLNG